MCCCGLNQINTLSVPTSISGDGAALDVSGLVADKTVELNGNYNGTYTVMGSHDGTLFVPLLTFDSGVGAQSVKLAVSAVMKFMKVRRNATNNGTSVVTVNLAARAAENCAKSGSAGANQFISLATLGVGLAQGPQPSIDLWTLVAATGLDEFNVACGGDFSGTLAFEGSLDGVNFAPVGEDASGNKIGGFTLGQKNNTLSVVPSLTPLLVNEIVRFVRINNLGVTVRSPVSVTIGGKQNCTC
jgi:hypothetical protein